MKTYFHITSQPSFAAAVSKLIKGSARCAVLTTGSSASLPTGGGDFPALTAAVSRLSAAGTSSCPNGAGHGSAVPHHFQHGNRDIPKHGDVGIGFGCKCHQHSVLREWIMSNCLCKSSTHPAMSNLSATDSRKIMIRNTRTYIGTLILCIRLQFIW